MYPKAEYIDVSADWCGIDIVLFHHGIDGL
jgi:hypothetical protein